MPSTIDYANQFGDTPLTWAARKGHLDVVMNLIANNADVNHVRQYNNTPLMWFFWNNGYEIMGILEERTILIFEEKWKPLPTYEQILQQDKDTLPTYEEAIKFKQNINTI